MNLIRMTKADQMNRPNLKFEKPHASNPASLLRSLTIIATISVLFIMTASTYGLYTVYARHIVTGAEDDAVDVSNALLNAHRNLLLSEENGRSVVRIDDNSVEALDRDLRKFLKPFSIIKIKIYSPRKEILYSTDRKIIGHMDVNNVRLGRALAGNNDSLLEKKEEVLDLADEKHFDVDVVETYVPIRDKLGKIIGSFEIYVDVTKYRNEHINVVVTSAIMLLLVISAVHVGALVVVRKLTGQLKTVHAELEQMAIKDELTGIFNRRHILSKANFKAISRQREGELTIGVLNMDVDYFKSVNDTYGHLVGDEVLKEISRRLTDSCRASDLAGRIGGEEFIVLLPDTAMTEIIAIAERIHRSVGEKPFHVEQHDLAVTISIGVACTRPGEKDLSQAIRRADTALYRAKNMGRNRIEIADT